MKRTAILIFFLLIILAAGGLWWIHGTSPVSADSTQKTFSVQPGEPLRTIANQLQADGLISDPIVFFLVTKMNRLDNKIEAGDFRLSPNMSALAIAKAMTTGTLDVWITVPEGFRAAEIAGVLKQKLPQYTSAWQTDLQANEGYLFPDTYSMGKSATIEQIIAQMRANFTAKYTQVQAVQTAKLTQNQIVTLASIVQREAITPSDMQMVASVLENRLSIGMPLGSDVTLEYALGYQPDEKTWWKKDLTADDLLLNTPYNTRINAGLPPTPISNPGLTALEAAAHPPQSDYLYYLSDSKGKLHFAKTLEEHNANIQKYL